MGELFINAYCILASGRFWPPSVQQKGVELKATIPTGWWWHCNLFFASGSFTHKFYALYVPYHMYIYGTFIQWRTQDEQFFGTWWACILICIFILICHRPKARLIKGVCKQWTGWLGLNCWTMWDRYIPVPTLQDSYLGLWNRSSRLLTLVPRFLSSHVSISDSNDHENYNIHVHIPHCFQIPVTQGEQQTPNSHPPLHRRQNIFEFGGEG